MIEPRTLSAESLPFMKDWVARLLDDCLAFKVGAPFAVAPTDMDEAALNAAARIHDEGEPLEVVVGTFRDAVLPSSLNFGASTFLAHPDCGNAIAAILGDFARALLQQNLSSFDYSPAASHLELALLKRMRALVGFPIDPTAQGTLVAGGAFVFGGAGANFACLLAAREHLKRRLARQGACFDPRRTRVLANRPFSHFSLRPSLHMLGLGNADLSDAQRRDLGVETECLRDVDSIHFRMDTGDLERRIVETLDRGEQIMCVFTTAGDSRMMAFDEIDAVADIAARYGLWVHDDACEGGQVLFSPRLRGLMVGAERANSISMDPHKVLMIPYNLSLFLLRDPADLVHVSGGAATVINQDDRTLGMYTPAINSKGFVSLKLWFLLKHWGWHLLADEIDRRHALARQAAAHVAGYSDLVLVNPQVQHNAVAFLYCPTDLRREVALDQINALNRAIHHRLNMETRYFVHAFSSRDEEGVVSRDHGMIYPLRMMFGNPLTTWDDVARCLEEIVRIGREQGVGPVGPCP